MKNKARTRIIIFLLDFIMLIKIEKIQRSLLDLKIDLKEAVVVFSHPCIEFSTEGSHTLSWPTESTYRTGLRTDRAHNELRLAVDSTI